MNWLGQQTVIDNHAWWNVCHRQCQHHPETELSQLWYCRISQPKRKRQLVLRCGSLVIVENTYAFSKNMWWINISAIWANKFVWQNVPKANDWSLATELGWTKRRSSEFSVLAVCIASLLVALSQVGRVAVQLTTNCSCNVRAHLKNNRPTMPNLYNYVLADKGSHSSKWKNHFKMDNSDLSIQVNCLHEHAFLYHFIVWCEEKENDMTSWMTTALFTWKVSWLP